MISSDTNTDPMLVEALVYLKAIGVEVVRDDRGDWSLYAVEGRSLTGGEIVALAVHRGMLGPPGVGLQ